jgi:hypothetical protein
MAPPMVELGAWAPDQPDVSNGGLRAAFNTACRGAMTGRSSGGLNFTVGGTLNRLYLATTGSLANVSNGGASPYTMAGGTNGNWWSFVLYGNRIVASDYTDAMESFIVGTSSNFAALSADSPRCKHLAVVRDFIVAGNIIGRGVNAATIPTSENAIQWSGLDDPTSWPQVGTLAAKSVQSDWQPLAGNGGQITSIVGGSDYGIVFQERAIWRMDYEGGDTFFRLTPIDENRGCWIHKAAIRVGGVTYFPSEDGFMATDGMQTVPIGNEMVDKFFIEQFDANSQPVLSCTYFPPWKCVLWLFQGVGAVNETPNTVLMFNVQSSRWAYASVGAEWLVSVLPFAGSLDSDSTSLDSGTYSAISLDSVVGATRRIPGAFDTSHGLSTFTGTPSTSFFETNEFEPDPGNVGTILSIRPVYDKVSSSFFAGLTTRMRMSDDKVTGPTMGEDVTGKMSLRSSGRYVSAYFSAFGEYKNFAGFDVNVVTRGAR